jgi:predicted dehydrogenase
MAKPVLFGIVGAGWRTSFFLRIAQALPERFRVGGMLVRNHEKGEALAARWNVPIYDTLDALLAVPHLQFVVVSVPRQVAPQYLRELTERQMPVLVETPPAPDLAGLHSLQPLLAADAKIQVAEQYQFQPLHAARSALARSDKLGTISQVQLSVAHGYHGISLIRQLLGVQFENAAISAREYSTLLVAGTDRNGNPPASEQIQPSRQMIATLDFGTKFAIYDFCNEQYHSWIRAPRVLVRGERGEITDTHVCYLQDFQTPLMLGLQRQDTGQNGNLEGHYHRGIMVGETWLYRNPFPFARLNDDEIAVATCLDKMAAYAAGGPAFYGLAQAAQDYYLSLLIDQACRTEQTIHSTTQSWAQ